MESCLTAVQNIIARAILGVPLRDHETNEWVRKKKFRNIIATAMKSSKRIWTRC